MSELRTHRACFRVYIDYPVHSWSLDNHGERLQIAKGAVIYTKAFNARKLDTFQTIKMQIFEFFQICRLCHHEGALQYTLLRHTRYGVCTKNSLMHSYAKSSYRTPCSDSKSRQRLR